MWGTGGASTAAPGCASATGAPASGSATGRGLIVLTSRGGGSVATGFGGSTFFCAPGRLPFPAGVSANMSPEEGSATRRCRAIRSTKLRATTSSIVLEALLTSMP
jgi:hypothetical protein